jgi:23S rRNA (guanosine2251-2'-O)-methyltransferase
VEAVLKAGKRDVQKIVLDPNSRNRRAIERVQRLASRCNIRVHKKSRKAIDEIAGGKSHGGVIALCGPYQPGSLTELYETAPQGMFVMLDGVEDPYNFGFAVRSLYAAGVAGVLVRPRNWMAAAQTVSRASAGSSELVEMAVAENPDEAAEFFKARDVQIWAAAETERAVQLYQADFTEPFFLLCGGEKRGIQRSFLEKADVHVQIPYGRPFSASLGTVAATSVLIFEAMRQRATKQPAQ